MMSAENIPKYTILFQSYFWFIQILYRVFVQDSEENKYTKFYYFSGDIFHSH